MSTFGFSWRCVTAASALWTLFGLDLGTAAAGEGHLQLRATLQSVADPGGEDPAREAQITAEMVRIQEKVGDLTDAQVAAVRRIVAARLDATKAFHNNEEFRKKLAKASKALSEAHQNCKSCEEARVRVLKANNDYEALYAPEREFQKKFEADLNAILTPEQDMKAFASDVRGQLKDRGPYGAVAATITDEQIKKAYEACQGQDAAARIQKACEMLRTGKDRILTPEQELAWLNAENDHTLDVWTGGRFDL